MADSSDPSYVLKGNRAEKHLIDLKEALAAYAERHPYEVRRRVEGKKNRVVWSFHFTEQPDPMVGLVAADFIYNIRSGLDHLMAALVPSSRRDSTMFPIFWKGVWDDPLPGENPERTKSRGRWTSCVKKVDENAVAILKGLQPDDGAGDDPETLHTLIALNRLSNTDRHSQLPVIAGSLHQPVGRAFDAQGRVSLSESLTDREGLKDGAALIIPTGVVEVEIEGTPVVVISVRSPDGFYRLPGPFEDLLASYRATIDLLRPYVRP